MIEGQMTLAQVMEKNKPEPKCMNCKHWELLPLNEQTEGWPSKGMCNNPKFRTFTTSAKSSCREEFEERDSDPSWLQEIRQLPNKGKNIYIKEELLQIEIDLWKKKIYNKNGVEIKGMENTFV